MSCQGSGKVEARGIGPARVSIIAPTYPPVKLSSTPSHRRPKVAHHKDIFVRVYSCASWISARHFEA